MPVYPGALRIARHTIGITETRDTVSFNLEATPNTTASAAARSSVSRGFPVARQQPHEIAVIISLTGIAPLFAGFGAHIHGRQRPLGIAALEDKIVQQAA